MTNKDTYFDEPDFESHMNFLIEEASLIVESDPYEALKMFNDANKLYDEVGCFPLGTLDLAVSIVVNIAKTNMDEAIKQLKIIDVECYELDALNDIFIYARDQTHIEYINNRIQELEKEIEKLELKK